MPSGEMMSLDYIIRIYRYEKDKPRELVGTVEEVGGRGENGLQRPRRAVEDPQPRNRLERTQLNV